MGSFEDIFKSIESTTKKDPNSQIYRSGDIKIGGSVPYGILSGIPRLDFSIGRPGLPVGRITEYFGFEMTSKTTAALHVLAQAQRAGGGGLYIDAEFAYDEDRAIDIGIDPDVNFSISQVDTIEGIFRQLDAAVKAVKETEFNKPFVLIVDSITAVSTEHERSKEYGQEARVGQDARVIKQSMRKFMPDFSRSNICLIFINHSISKIGGPAFAKQSQSSGGHAIKFFATLRCEFVNAGQIKDKSDPDLRLGQKININIEKLKKSRLERPKIKEIALLNETGLDLTTELLVAATQYGFITKKNIKVYQMGENEFSKADWPQVVTDNGGPDKMYELLIQWGMENGKIRKWNESEYE